MESKAVRRFLQTPIRAFGRSHRPKPLPPPGLPSGPRLLARFASITLAAAALLVAAAPSAHAQRLAFVTGDDDAGPAGIGAFAWLSNGDGTFTQCRVGTTGFNRDGVGTEVFGGLTSAETFFVDVNGDGLADIVHATDNNNRSIYTWLAQGNGAFATTAVATTAINNTGVGGTAFAGGHVAGQQSFLVDVTGDGIPDYVYTRDSANLGVFVWPGNGDGTFSTAAPQATTAFTGAPASGITGQDLDEHTFLLDVTGDGDPDLVHATESNGRTIVVWPGNAGAGVGTFQTTPTTSTGFVNTGVTGQFAGTAATESSFMGDVTGDNVPDFVFASDSGIYVWAGTGGGNFSTAAPIATTTFVKPFASFAGQGATKDAQLVDVTGDSILDYVMSKEDEAANAGIYVWPGNGDGTFAINAIATRASGGLMAFQTGFSGTENAGIVPLIAASQTFLTNGCTATAPGGVGANLLVWNKADAGIAAADGATVDRWTNVVDATWSVTQATLAARPTYYATTTARLLNFNPALSFDAGDELFRNARLHHGTAGFQAFSVVRDERPAVGTLRGFMGLGDNGNDPAMDLQADGVSPNGWNPWIDGSTPVEYGGSTALLFNGNGGGANRQPQIFSLGSANGGTNNIVSVVDGFEEATTLDANNQAGIGGGLWTGSSVDAQWLGLIAEQIVYSRRLTANEQQRVNSYLAFKYGITLGIAGGGPQDYLTSAGATIWSATANAGYTSDVAGIGRDDGSALNQKQSSSVNANSLVTIGLGTIAATNAANVNTLANGAFMTWGRNSGDAKPSIAVPSTELLRMARVWKVQETGAVGSVRVRIPASALAGSTPALIRSTDETFATGNTIVPLTAVGSDYEASIDFANGDFFTFATFLTAPGGVFANLTHWARADGGLFVDFAGTTPASPNGLVGRWNDSSGNAIDAKSSSNGGAADDLAKRPTLLAGAPQFNFNPAISFAGNKNFVYNGRVLDVTDNGTLFGVARWSTQAGYQNWYGFGPVGNDPGFHILNSTSHVLYDDTSPNITYPTAVPIDRLNLLGSDWTFGVANDVQMSFNGRRQLTTGEILNNVERDDRMCIGNDCFSGEPFNGQITEVMTYDRRLTPVEQQRVNTYLAIKYGISLDQTTATDYLDSAAAVIWDAAGAGVYRNNITGIGRDDVSGLVQKQSRNVNTTNGGDLVTLGLGTIVATNGENASVLPDDRSFLIWADDGATTDFATPVAVPAGIEANRRTSRVWRVQETGTVGSVKIAVPGTMGAGAAVYLVVSSDPTFDAADQFLPLTSLTVAGTNYLAADIDLASGQYFAFATRNAAPGGVNAGLSVWLKANAGTNVNTAGNFVNGTGWLDQSGRARHANIVFGDPQLVDAGLNFNPTVVFDASDWFRFTASPFVNAFTAGEAFTVTKDLSPGIGNHGNPYDFGSSSRGSHYTWGDGAIYNGFGTTDRLGWHPVSKAILDGKPGVALAGPPVSTGTYHVYRTHSAANDWGVSFDGITAASTATNAVSFALASGNEHVGAFSSSAFHGETTEVFLYNRTLTAAERQRVTSYLAIKYGITQFAPAGGPQDYLSSAGTVIWNGIANAAYHNDVAGLGRDDSSGLDQRQSSSINPGNFLTIAHGTVAPTNAQNSASMPADDTFLVWGSDTGTTILDTLVTGTDLSRMARVWRVQETGNSGLMTVRVPSSIFGSGTSPLMIVSADPIFDDTDTQLSMFVSGANADVSVDFTNGQYFTFAAVIARPGGVGGALVWLRGDYGSGTTTWFDASPFARNGTLSSGIAAADLLNFNRVVRFNASTFYTIPIDINPAALDPLTAFVSFRANDNTGIWGNDNGDFDRFVLVNSIGTGTASAAFGGAALSTGRTITTVMDEAQTNGSFVYVSGAQQLNFTQNGTAGGITTTTLGRHYTAVGAGAMFGGQIGEFIVFGTLTQAQRERVQSYLGLKYGETLGHNYVASDGTTVFWDRTVNTGYNTRIAGIGRDDTSALVQKQSTSTDTGSIVTIGLGPLAADNVSNTGTFAVDRSFMVWGDNNASTAWGTAIGSSTLRRMARIWKVQETGTVGTVVVRISKSTLGGIAPTLFRSTDATFEDTDTKVPMTANGSFLEATIDFVASDYFTFASENGPTLRNNGDGYLTDGDIAGMAIATPACSATQFWEHMPVVQQGVFSGANVGGVIQGGLTVNESTHLADVDNDGKLDILWIYDNGGPGANNGTYVWLGNGDGTFQTNALRDTGSFTGGPIFPTYMPAGGASGNESTHIADVNGDGNVDIVWLWDGNGNAANAGTWVWPGNGNGTFQHAAIIDHGLLSDLHAFFPAGGYSPNESTDLVDVNNDGRLDIVWVSDIGNTNSPNGGTWVWLGNGDGTWQHAVTRTNNMAGGTGFTFSAAGGLTPNESTHLVDLDKDGFIDLLWIYDAGVTANSGVRWWKGNGDGTFQQTVNQDFGFQGGPGLAWGAPGGQTGNETTRVLDVNRDGNLDVLWTWDAGGTTAQSGSYVYLGNGDGTFNKTPLVDVGSFGGTTNVADILQAGLSGAEHSLVGDLNNDGMPDLLWVWDGGGAATSGTWAWLGKDGDKDGLADLVDPDDDNDGIPDTSDTCEGPGSISPDVQLWLKADDGATLGGVDTVTHWLDHSTFGRDANLAFGAAQLVAGGVNFNPTVRFDGADFFRFGKSPFVNTFTAGEVFSVVKNSQAVGALNGHPFDFGSGARDSAYVWSDNAVYDGFGTNDRFGFNPLTQVITADGKAGITAIAGPPIDSRVYHLYNTRSATGDWGIRFDGNATATTSTNTVSFGLIAGNEHLGAVSGRVFVGDIAEVILYNRTLTALERSQVESYLATKYGLTLGHDYLASDDTTVYWNMAANAAYHNNVAGIGRDDGVTLDQRQSTSANPGSVVAIGLGTIAADNPSNPNAFSDDLRFMMWGDNNATTAFDVLIESPTPGAANRRMARVWKVQETGTVGTVTVGAPETTGTGKPVYLVISNDEVFDPTDQWLELTPLTAGSAIWQTATTDFTSGQFFTFATSITAPGGVTGNFDLWLKANAGASTTTEGSPVDTWFDQSGSGNNAENATDAWQPLFRTNSAEFMNFNPVLAFDSANDWMRVNTINANPASKNPLSVAMSYRISDGGGLYGNDNGQFDLGHFTNAVLGAEAVVGYSGGHVAGQALLNGAYYNHGVGNGSSVFVNNRSVLNFTYNGANGGNGYLDIGVNGQPCSGCENFFGGWMSEYILYSRTLTTVERQKIDSYLAIKYGVTLDQTSPTNYLDSTAAVIWNAATAGAFNKNVAGIGRDDVSALVQRQSRSANVPTGGDLVTIGLSTIAVDNGSNTSTFAADRNFLMWGDDGAATTFSAAMAPPSGGIGLRMPRAWNVQETGTIGAVTVGVPVATGAGAPLYLVVSNDAVIDAADVWTPMAPLSNGDTTYLAATHDFATGQFFTFATVIPEDYGDAPASYGTTIATNGPRHAVPGYDAVNRTAPLMLGTAIDVESDGQPTATATGDDARGGDDEDGVTFPAVIAGQAVNLAVAVTNSGPAARLSVWADWNNNGSFGDAGEQVAADVAAVAGVNTVPMTAPASATGTVNVRVRLSTQAGLSAVGVAPDGEVEDYQAVIQRQADLVISKTDGAAAYTPGAPITYTIVVTNAGPSTASGVAIADSVPANITGVTVACVAAGTATCGTNATTGNAISFTNVSLAAGAGNQLTLTVSGVVSAAATGDLINTAQVTAGAGETDPNLANNTATDTDTQGPGSADLTITKSDGLAGYTPGAPITYTVTVTNAGPSNANAIDISDVVPASITGVTVNCVATGAAACGTDASSGNTVAFTGASLEAGAANRLTLTISGTIDPGASGAITNTAQVLVPGGATYTDPNLGNNGSTDTNTQGTPQIDLAVTKTNGQTSYVPGARVTYTIEVTNAGPSTANGFAIADLVPASITNVSVTCSVVGLGSCGTNATAGNNVAFNNASLAPGAVNLLRVTISGTVSPNTTGDLTNTATATAGGGANDTAPANNSASDTDTQGAGQSDLRITKTNNQAGYIAGTSVTYTIGVFNDGPSHAPALDISDAVPAMITGVTVNCTVNGTASCGVNNSSGNAVSFTGASLNAGAGHSLTITITGTIDPDFTSADIVNMAQVAVPAAAGYTDPNLGNNSAIDTDTPLPQEVDLAITKTDGQASYVPGAPIAYTLVVTNAGPSTATDVNITDLVPASITGVTAACVVTGTGNCGSAGAPGNAVSFTNASLAAGAGHSLTITITGTVDPDTTGDLINSATVTEGTNATETAPANNTVSDTDTQGAGVADLVISKTDGSSVYTPGTAVTYQIVVTNNGPSHADGFDVTDAVPAAITGVGVSCGVSSGVGTCGTNASSGNNVAFTGATLEVGSALTITLTGTIDPSATGDLGNTASVTVPGGAPFTDPDTANNAATDTDTATAQAIDLTVSVDDGQATYVPGTLVTYTITVTNAGPSTATGFNFGDTIPASLTNVTVGCVATAGSNCGTDSSSGSSVLFSNATLLPGSGTLTLTITGTIAPDATGNLVSTATVTAGSGANEGSTADNTATDTDTPAPPQVDLTVTKSNGQTTYVPGTPVTYTITVTNGGPSTATGFSITDNVPAAITGVSVTCVVTGTGDCGTNASSGNAISFTDASLPPGAGNALTLTINGVVTPGASGPLANTVTVAPAAGVTDTNPANDNATDTDTPGVSHVDLTVTKTDGQTEYVAGTPIAYTIVVTNAGPSTATGVSIGDNVPAAITGVTVNCVATGGANCGADGSSGNAISFTNAIVPPGGAALTLTVSGTVSPSATGAIGNTVTVSAAGATDTNPGDNLATDTDTEAPRQVDLVITKTNGQTTYVPGMPVTYTIVVSNAGPSEATGVTINDVVPAEITGLSVTCAAAGSATCGSNGTAGNGVAFSNVTLPPGAGNTLTLTINGTISASAAGTLANTATVTAGAGATETTPSNNSATDSDTQGTSQVELTITKSNGQTTYVPGTAVSYTIVVSNAGPSTAAGVSINDVVPAAISGITVNCTAGGTSLCGAVAPTGNTVAITNATVAPGAANALTITVNGTIDPGATGNIVNTAAVTAGAGSNEANTADNSATDTDTPGTGSADLIITKTDGQSGYVAGTPITYTVTVTNTGPSNANAVDISDVVPSSITGVSVSCTVSGTASCGTNASSGNTVAFTGASINAGAGHSLTLTISGTIDPAAAGNLVNTAQVIVPAAATYTDPNLGNNTAADTNTQGTAEVDLTITKSDGRTSYVPGAPITYTLVVTNAGPSLATAINISDVVPASITGVTANCTLVGFGSCGTNSSSGNTISFTNATLAPGAVNTLTIKISGTVSPNLTGDLTNSASVTALGATELNAADNSATDVDTQGAGESDLAITKTDGQAGYIAGTTVSYTLTVTNLGPSHAPSFEVHDAIPPMITGVTVSCATTGTASCGADGSSGNTIAFTGASLNAGAGNSLVITVTGTVDPGFMGGDMVNAAEVRVPAAAGYSDPVLGNNTVTDMDTPLPQHVDLVITKTNGQTSYVPGAPVTYTLVVTNNGPSTATDVNISDMLPASISGVTASCVATGVASCGSNATAGNAVSFTNASLYPGAGNSLTITITGTVSPDMTGDLANTATVTAGTGAVETTPANNTASDTDTQGGNISDLRVTKTDGAAVYTAGTAIAYQIVVTNNGPSHADGFAIDDLVPAAITGVTVNCAITSGVGACGTNATSGNSVSFLGASLNAGSSLTLTVTGTIDPSATADIVNTAAVTVPGAASFTDPDTANNTATDTDTATAQSIDLAIAIDDGQLSYVPGTPVTYTITVTNGGPSTATGFSFGDTVPAALTGVTVNCTPGAGSSCGSNSSSGSNVLFSNATLLPGDTLTLTVSGTIAPSTTGDLVHAATVTPGPGANEANTTDNNATDTDTTGTSQVDLIVAKSDGGTTYVPGTSINYTITVTNAGPSTAVDFSLNDTVPAAITNVTVSCAVTGTATCGTNGSSGNTIAFTGLSLEPGAAHALTFIVSGVVDPGASGTIDNTVTVAAGGGATDTAPGNNTATDSNTQGTSLVDLAIAKTDGQTAYVPGTPIVYTLTVTNAGPSMATGVSIADSVPASIAGVTVNCVVTGTGACGTNGSSGNAISFTNANLAPGAGNLLTYTISGTVRPDATGPLANTATVVAGAGTSDTNGTNNSATDSDTPGTSQVDLIITKSDGQTTYVPGTPITYTIVVTNAGPSMANGITISDAVPGAIAGVTVNCTVTGTGLCGTNASSGNAVSFLNASLAPGAGNALTLTVTGTINAAATGPIANTATVAAGAGANDTDGTNNSATDTNTAGTSQVDLQITKNDGQTTYVPGTPISYTIVVTNAGPSHATGVTITDAVPAAITGVTVSCTPAGAADCGTNGSSGNAISFTNVNLAPGATNSLTLVVNGTTDPAATGPLTNTATVIAGPGAVDTNPANDSATDTDTDSVSADVQITQTVPAGTVTPGEQVTYTLTASNAGPSTATDAVVTATLPAGLVLVSSPEGCTAAPNGGGQTITCPALATLGPGGTGVFTLIVQLDPAYTGDGSDLPSTASVTADTADPDTSNNTTPPATITVGAPSSDVQIVKSVSAAQVLPGESYTYTLHVRNNGPSLATGIQATDTLPLQTTFVSSSAGCTASGQSVVCPALASLAVGATTTFDIVVQLNPAYVGDGTDILNSAMVTAATADPALANNSSPAGAPPVGPPGADVAVVKNVTSASVTPGGSYTYTVMASNQGPSVATNVVVTDPLPAGVIFQSSPEGCTVSGQIVTCPTVASLAPGESATFTLHVQLDPSYTGNGSDIQNRASVTAAEFDPAPANNTSPPATPVIGPPSADLLLTKAVVESSVAPGQTFTYRVTVTNAGPSTALGVTVKDTLPAPVTFLHSPQGCTAIGQDVTCPPIGLAVGAGATFDLVVRLAPDFRGTSAEIVNVATVTSEAPDPNPTNNENPPTPAPPIVLPVEADVIVEKKGPIGPVPANAEISYTIVVTNQGPGTAENVVVHDPTPAGLTFVGTSGDCATVFPCALGSLAAGQAKTIEARYMVNGAPGVVVNTATVTTATIDPTPANNAASAKTPPEPIHYYLSEGATGTFFDTNLLLANPNRADAPVTLTFFREDGQTFVERRTLAAQSRMTVKVEELAGLEFSTMSMKVTSDLGYPLAVERTMVWDATTYGGHTATAVPAPATRWYFGEGSQGFFDTYLLLENDHADPVNVTVTFLREGSAPFVKALTVAPTSRFTLQVATIPEMADSSFGMVVDAAAPIVAERAMYFGNTAARVWTGGHSSAGVTGLSRRWFHPEGATGGFFDTFILMGNPHDVEAHVTMEFILQSGEVVAIPKTIPAHGRLTINPEVEDPRLANASVSTRVLSDVPIVSERSMYWIGDTDVAPWGEAHNSFGLTDSAVRQALADGRVGAPSNYTTYILLSNPWEAPAEVKVTYLRENGAPPIVKTYTVPPTTRFNIDVHGQVPELHDESFGAFIEVTNGYTIAVERSIYWDANGVFWGGGTNAPATRVP